MRSRLARRLRTTADRLAPPVPSPAEQAPAAPPVDIETQRLIHKEVKERSARLDAASARLDTKAATLLGFVSAACIFLATQDVGGWWKVPAYVAWAGTVAFGLLSMRVRRWREAPEPEPLRRLVGRRSEAAALALLTAAQVDAFTVNRTIHESKARHWRIGLGFLVAAVLLTAAAITLGGTRDDNRQQRPGPAGSGVPTSAAAVR
jgi:hypothetical protein